MVGSSYLDPYRNAVSRHGSGFEATLWASEKTQRLRFEVFLGLCYFGSKRVLDAGCGPGDFAAFLLDHNVGYDRYIGLDGLPEVIDAAQQRELARTQFHAGDFVIAPQILSIGQPQIITISGALNTMDDATALSVLGNAWLAAGESLLFNFLSDRAIGAPQQQGPARRLPTLRILDWALRRTPEVQMRHDYFPNGHDVTILMHKSQS